MREALTMSPGATPPHIPGLFTGGPGISPQIPGSGLYTQIPVQQPMQPPQIFPPAGGGVAVTSPGSGKYIAPTHGAYTTGGGEPVCWICPPYGSSAAPHEAALSVCALYQANPSQFPSGYSANLVAAGQGPPCAGQSGPSPPFQLPPTTGGGATAVTRGYSQLPPAVPSKSPNVTINGQPMICCPCTT